MSNPKSKPQDAVVEQEDGDEVITTFSDGATFSDGSGWSQPPVPAADDEFREKPGA
jgi:hypothetical protein